MQRVDELILGAGVSGLAYAKARRGQAARRGLVPPTMQILEREGQPGGYCRTVHQDGFSWDYSGHFFHFRRPEVGAWLREGMDAGEVLQVEKRSAIRYRGVDVDFPFQKNIHQLPREDFIRCLTELYFKDERHGGAPQSFKQLVYQRYGAGIAEAFLVPYNEKLYACDLDQLDVDAMGRFFPQAEVAEIFRNMEQADNRSYNSHFEYPVGGAERYVRALLSGLPEGALSCEEPALSIDLQRKIVRTPRRELAYGRLISSLPLPRLLELTGLDHDRDAFRWNKVRVFNLGFDRPASHPYHWVYFPDPELSFYRVGWYSNLDRSASATSAEAPRMSLYVEIGLAADADVEVQAALQRVLAELRAQGIVTGQRLVSWHSVLMDPAYVHIRPESKREQARLTPLLQAGGVHAIGRYGAWTYCSIEDNLVEARALAEDLAEAPQ